MIFQYTVCLGREGSCMLALKEDRMQYGIFLGVDILLRLLNTLFSGSPSGDDDAHFIEDDERERHHDLRCNIWRGENCGQDKRT